MNLDDPVRLAAEEHGKLLIRFVCKEHGKQVAVVRRSSHGPVFIATVDVPDPQAVADKREMRRAGHSAGRPKPIRAERHRLLDGEDHPLPGWCRKCGDKPLDVARVRAQVEDAERSERRTVPV